MRLIDADEVKRFYKTKFKDLDNGVHWSRNDILMNLDCIETVDIAPVIRCHNCKYFELNHWENVNGIPLIVAHGICTKWGDGCKTSMDGYCFLAEREKKKEEEEND